jgi:hypothetical protein
LGGSSGESVLFTSALPLLIGNCRRELAEKGNLRLGESHRLRLSSDEKPADGWYDQVRSV